MENSTENKKDLKNFDIYRFAVTKKDGQTKKVVEPSTLATVLHDPIQLEGDGKDANRYPPFHYVCRGEIWAGEPEKIHPRKLQNQDYTKRQEDDFQSGWVVLDARHGLIAIQRCQAFDYNTLSMARLLRATLHKRLAPLKYNIEMTLIKEEGDFTEKLRHLTADRGVGIKSVRFDTALLLADKSQLGANALWIEALAELNDEENETSFDVKRKYGQQYDNLDQLHPTVRMLLKYCAKHATGAVAVQLTDGYGSLRPDDTLYFSARMNLSNVETFANDGDLSDMPRDDEPGYLLVRWLDHLYDQSKLLPDVQL